MRRLAAADRKALGEQIAASRERWRASAAATGSAGARPALDDTITLEQVSQDLLASMKEAIPILSECYAQAFGSDASTHRVAAVKMDMVSDPDLGTVIDTATMTDGAGQALDPKLDDCLRTTIESLALPPFDVGGRLKIQYSFSFD